MLEEYLKASDLFAWDALFNVACDPFEGWSSCRAFVIHSRVNPEYDALCGFVALERP